MALIDSFTELGTEFEPACFLLLRTGFGHDAVERGGRGGRGREGGGKTFAGGVGAGVRTGVGSSGRLWRGKEGRGKTAGRVEEEGRRARSREEVDIANIISRPCLTVSGPCIV